MVNACRATAIEYTCTKFGVDSSSRFPFRVRTNRQTDKQTRLNALPMPAAIQPAWVITNKTPCSSKSILRADEDVAFMFAIPAKNQLKIGNGPGIAGRRSRLQLYDPMCQTAMSGRRVQSHSGRSTLTMLPSWTVPVVLDGINGRRLRWSDGTSPPTFIARRTPSRRQLLAFVVAWDR